MSRFTYEATVHILTTFGMRRQQ